MTRITPEQFKDAYLRAVSASEEEILARWDGKPDYTSLIRKTVLPAIAPHLNVQVYAADYYTLDCIYYAERDTDNFPPNLTYAKCICIALEHENEIEGSAVEMNKLQLFNVPLKVLITYPRHGSDRAAYLERYTKILRGADIFGDFATHRRQLVIFGEKQETTVNWCFYVYEAAGFQGIRDQ